MKGLCIFIQSGIRIKIRYTFFDDLCRIKINLKFTLFVYSLIYDFNLFLHYLIT